VVHKVDSSEGSEGVGSDFEDCGWDWVTDYEMALVVEGLGEGFGVDEGVAG
jgi:hypothetical protein